MKINGIKCLECKDIIYSRARHDSHSCSCGACFIDGGFDYTKIGGNAEDFKRIEIDVETTKQELYDDWNRRIDKFGIIKPMYHDISCNCYDCRAGLSDRAKD